MSKIKLPQLAKYKVVAFHYKPTRNSHKVILQVPDNEFAASSTYKINLDDAGDTAWLLSHKNGQQVVDKLNLHGHVAYRPEQGEIEILEETNGQTTTARLNPANVQAGRIPDRDWQRSAKGYWSRKILQYGKQK